MRRLIALALMFTLSGVGPALAAPQAPRSASISGDATNALGQPAAQMTVQLRNAANGEVVATTTSAANGAFSFTGLAAGTYLVEAVNAAGQVVSTSPIITLAAEAAITGVAIRAAAAGSSSQTAQARRSFFTSKFGIITTIAAAAAVAGVTVAATQPTASPSK
jgi:hypothetical protein